MEKGKDRDTLARACVRGHDKLILLYRISARTRVRATDLGAFQGKYFVLFKSNIHKCKHAAKTAVAGARQKSIVLAIGPRGYRECHVSYAELQIAADNLCFLRMVTNNVEKNLRKLPLIFKVIK